MKSSAAHESKGTPGPLARLFEHRRPVILDGAMGTELERRGVSTGLPLWSAHALLTSPGKVRQIHDEYIDAGADIITSNTFRTTRRTFLRAGLTDRSAELTSLAVSLARESSAAFPGKRVLVAGSMAPLEDCYSPELVPADDALREEHGQHAGRLADAGVDFLLLETMGTLREGAAAAEVARGTGLEFVVSFLCRGDGSLYGGEPLGEAVRLVMGLSPAAISLNCVSPGSMEVLLAYLQFALRGIPGGGNVPIGLYANVGAPGGEHGTRFIRDVGPAAYAEFAGSWARAGVSLIGGCCGTTPEYIRAIVGAFASERRTHET
jgi:S-methylmethionine-dependent homocysteine/selenocysteine methylase